MRIGIISDIHSNLEAFEVSLNYFENQKIDKLIILGDVIGYGPDPQECIKLTEKANIILKGNHEHGLIENDFSRFKKIAKISLEWTIKKIKEEKMKQIRTWKEKEEMEDIIFVHASISKPFYKYLIKKEDAEQEFKIMEKKICFVSHTHIPGAFKKNMEKEEIEKIYPDLNGKMEIKIQEGFKYIINVGSSGFPRDGFPLICVSIFDTEKKEFKLNRISYPVEITWKKIIENGLPSKIADNLLRGI